ncbi:MAG TPA: AAA family ATPase [Thermoanaerobaculales bacterium]|nr:AAA family ATPase [Thermoanaerobaculales bacterium]HPA79418.1 AAA family ATPase [Thermoanaerobaculales bacterium]HQL30466.1 AAA family ATPase [Thermoanaerobaculales bacterium]HQN96607.1 AAA family ATPase [Thermoanaerobaculales bacterium]HQP44282.1 AAA family ATPase [Thermoanaerobaculales bacterium]
MRLATQTTLRRWRLRNFKSIPAADLELAQLTVLVGANSSGKSSLIQSMLLAAQAAGAPPGEPGIPLNGPLVELGELLDVRRTGTGSREAVALGCTVACGGHGPEGGRELEWDVELATGPLQEGSGLARARRVRLSCPVDAGSRLELVAERRTRGSSGPAGRPDTSGAVAPSLVGRVRWSRNGAEDAGSATVGLALRGGIPESLLVRADRNAIAVDLWARRARQAFAAHRRPSLTAAGGAGEGHRAGELAGAAAGRLVPLVAAAIRAAAAGEESSGPAIGAVFSAFAELRQDAARRGYWDALSARVIGREFADSVAAEVGRGGEVARPAVDDPDTAEMARHVEQAAAALAELLSTRVLHLGPLRQDPQVLYRNAPSGRPGFVGSRGEYAIAALHRQAARERSCPLADGSVQAMALGEAVNHWLGALGLAASIDTSDRARLGLEARLTMPEVGRSLGMPAVGVGVSQVLPVLVMALAAGPGSVLLLEQPELHLHPAVQQRLGDFLLACAASGRQVIVETHSDHLVTRLRRRIAEDPGDELVERVAIVLAERDAGGTRFRRLPTNRYGGLDEWPEGFFDEGALDSRELLRAGLRKRGDVAQGG